MGTPRANWTARDFEVMAKLASEIMTEQGTITQVKTLIKFLDTCEANGCLMANDPETTRFKRELFITRIEQYLGYRLTLTREFREGRDLSRSGGTKF